MCCEISKDFSQKTINKWNLEEKKYFKFPRNALNCDL